MRRERHSFAGHLTYANVVASLALFLVLGGAGAYASGLIGSHDIKDDAVKSRHIAPHEVKTSDLAKGVVGSVAGSIGLGTPPSNPQTKGDDDMTVKLKSPASIVVIGALALHLECGTSGQCAMEAGLYVNGKGLAGSDAANSGGSESYSTRTTQVVAVSGVLSPGTYHVYDAFSTDDSPNFFPPVDASVVAHVIALTVPAG